MAPTPRMAPTPASWALAAVLLALSKAPRQAQAFAPRCAGAASRRAAAAAAAAGTRPAPLPTRAALRVRQPCSAGVGAVRRFGPGAASRLFGGVWGLPVPAAAPLGARDVEIDWGEPCKEELVLDARLAERDEVPSWARAMVIRGQQVQVHFYKGGKTLPPYLLGDAFDLTKANMEKMYVESIWGWSDEQKRGDLESPLARYFVATDERGRLQGFIHYRFEVIDNKFTHETSAAAYVLELQVADSARRLGLGTLLMQAVEEVAVRTKMDSSMLCVFRYNEPAVNFYLNRMGYRIDQSSAFNDNQQDVWELVKPSAALGFGGPAPPHSCSQTDPRPFDSPNDR